MTDLSLFLFDYPGLMRGRDIVKVNRRKALALVAYLSLADTPQSRETLSALFWPEFEPAAARASLGTGLWQLRRLFGLSVSAVDRERLRLHPDFKLWVDVNEFRQLLAKSKVHCRSGSDLCPICAASLMRAVELYRGDFMQGFFLPDNETFEHWQRLQAEDLRREFIHALQTLMFFHEARQEYEKAVHHARRRLEMDSLDETAHLHLMRLYARSGNKTAALRQYETCARILKKELDVEPQAALTKLQAGIKSNELPPAAAVPRKENFSAAPGQTPQPPELCIGREKELQAIREILQNESCRLLSLVGPGGIGKTLLATKIFCEPNSLFQDGACFVALSDLLDPELVVEVIAEALNLTFHHETDHAAQLLQYLSNKQLLLILDNYEHLLESRSIVSEILEKSSSVKILATSQRRLNLRAEWVLEIPALDYPPGETTDGMESFGAVKLFTERARHARHSFRLEEKDKLPLAFICRYLEGMPLGIELAAGLSSYFSCREIAEELKRDLGFLTTTMKDMAERHRSLQAMFDRSLQLLTPREKQILENLSIFKGGFTGETARAAAEAGLSDLLSLKDKSFIRRNIAGRFEMPTVLQRFIGEQTAGFPQRGAEIGSRHAEYFGQWLKDKEADFKGGLRIRTLAEIAGEADNIQAGWQWAVQKKRWDLVDAYLEGLFQFHQLRGRHRHGKQLLDEALKAPADSPADPNVSALKGKILSRQGWFHLNLNQYEAAQTVLRESISILKSWDLATELGWALNRLAVLYRRWTRLDEARHLFEESLEILSGVGDSSGITENIKGLGNVAYAGGDYETARKMYSQALEDYKKRDDPQGISSVLTNLGLVSEMKGLYAEAVALHRESLQLHEEIDNAWGRSDRINNLGFAYYGKGDYEEAESCFRKAVQSGRAIQAPTLMEEGLLGLSFILFIKQKFETAVKTVGYLLQRPALNMLLRKRVETLADELKNKYSRDAFVALLQKGAEQPWERLIELFEEEVL